MNIFCVIVCYNPDISNLTRICKVLKFSHVTVILVDNTEVSSLDNLSSDFDIQLIKLNDNQGVAKAQNIGIRYALENNAEIIVFFDQDSFIDNDFISKLVRPLIINQPMVVSPVINDKKNGFEFPSYKLNRVGLLRKMNKCNNDEPIFADVIISSGSAATKEVFHIVGLMNEDLFIDFIDTEWSLRCKAKGVPILVVPNAKMVHSIGDISVNLFFTRLFIHSPLRTYYKVRNSFLFFRNKNVPFLMGIKEIISALINNFLIIFFIEEKINFVVRYFQGIRDGFLNRKGKINI
jgi:rhamnosyltransferase